MDLSESTKVRIKTVEKIKENIIAGEKVVEEVVNVVKPQYSAPTHSCFGVFNIVCDYFLAWYYKIPSLDINACSKIDKSD